MGTPCEVVVAGPGSNPGRGRRLCNILSSTVSVHLTGDGYPGLKTYSVSVPRRRLSVDETHPPLLPPWWCHLPNLVGTTVMPSGFTSQNRPCPAKVLGKDTLQKKLSPWYGNIPGTHTVVYPATKCTLLRIKRVKVVRYFLWLQTVFNSQNQGSGKSLSKTNFKIQQVTVYN